MLKRIIASILIVTSLVCIYMVSVSADDTQTSIIITQWDGTIPANGTTVAGGSNFLSTTDLFSNHKNMAVRSKGNGPGVTSATENGDSYLVVSHSSLLCNYRSLISTWVKDATPVASIKYDIRIPEDDYSEKPRTMRFDFTTASGSTAKNPTNVKVVASNGVFSPSVTDADSNEVAGTSITAPYTVGNWATVEVRGYRTERNTLEIGIYVDEKQIFYGESTSTAYTGDLAITQMYIEQSTYKDSTGATTTFSTDYDDITIAANSVENAPADFSIVNDIIDIDFSGVSETEVTTLAAASKGKFSAILQESSNSTAPFKGTTKYKAVAKSADDSNPVLDVVTTADGKSTQRLYLTQLSRGSLASYVNVEEETVLKYSYDIFIPSGTASSSRKHEVLFAGNGNLGTTTNNNKYTEGGLCVTSQIRDGKLSFYTSEENENSTFVPLTLRSEEVEVESDAWNTVEYVLKITQDAENSLYNVKVYGMYKGNCCYTNECVVYGDAFGICGNKYYIYGTGKGLSSIETKYDNISLQHISNWQEDTYNYNAWINDYIYPLSLSCNAETGVTANAKIDNSKGTYTDKLCLVVALYNSNGNLEKIYTDKILEDGYIKFTTNDSEFVKSGYTAKAFLFDSITSVVPYVNNVELVIE